MDQLNGTSTMHSEHFSPYRSDGKLVGFFAEEVWQALADFDHSMDLYA